MKKHQKIQSHERDKIAYWHAIGQSIRAIARQLGRSPSSISVELRRNKVDGIYHSIHAHKTSEARKKLAHKKYLLRNRPVLKNYVLEKLDSGWSPQQIAGRLKKEIVEGKRPQEEYINYESIYQYIYDPQQKEQRLWEHLPRSHKKRRRWLGRRSRPVTIPNRVSIRHRPEEVNNRLVFGHWEGDTIVGEGHKTGIHTEVERVSRFLLAQIIPHVRAQDTYEAQFSLFMQVPKQARKSTTLDNGIENGLHSQLQKEFAMQTYFAHPYCSWQRGTNEYTNGLVRRYFPKRTDFSKVSDLTLNEVVNRLNNTPRKVLKYQTPLEVFTARFFQSL